MSSKMLVTMKLDQRLAMNQQLRQAIELLQYNSVELRQLVQQHIESNPLLEIEDAETESTDEQDDSIEDVNNDDEVLPNHYHQNSMSRSFSDATIENYSTDKSLREHLTEQTLLCHFNPTQQMIAEYIIDSIDDNGFLPLQPDEILESLNKQQTVNAQQISDVLKKIQAFDPPGVASTNIRGCLLNQLNNYEKKDKVWELACSIVNQLSNDVCASSIKKVIKEIKSNSPMYRDAINLIKSFNFYPGAQYVSDRTLYFEPELYVKKINDQWEVFLVEGALTNIKVNKEYHDLIKKQKAHQSYPSLKRELEEAKWLVNGLKKRNETLLNVAKHIIQMQMDFLESGVEFMKPMNITDISVALELHESTVSRVTTGKYISTPRGVFELKYFFPSHVMKESGETCSAISVKSLIKELISKETASQIFSDNDIVSYLKEKGINIARRTVAKYRESMNILSSYQRQMKHDANFSDEPELA